MAGRPPKYVQETLDLQDEVGYTPAQVADSCGCSGEERRLMVQAFNGRAARIRDRWGLIPTVGEQAGCYPGVLWKATLPKSAHASPQDHQNINQRAQAWVDAAKSSESERLDSHNENVFDYARNTLPVQPVPDKPTVDYIEVAEASVKSRFQWRVPTIHVGRHWRKLSAGVAVLGALALFVMFPFSKAYTPLETVDQMRASENLMGLRGLLNDASYSPLRTYIIEAIANVQSASQSPYYETDSKGFVSGMLAIFTIEPAMIVMEDRILEVGDWLTVDSTKGYITAIEASQIVLETSMGFESIEVPAMVVFDYHYVEPYPISLFPAAANGNVIMAAVAERLGFQFDATNDVNMFGYSKSKSYEAFLEETSVSLGITRDADRLISQPGGMPGFIGFADFAGIRPTMLPAMFESYGQVLGWKIDYKALRDDEVSYAPRQFDEVLEDVALQVRFDYQTRTATIM